LATRNQSASRRQALIIGVLALVMFVIAPLVSWACGVWIDWLWYGEMGQRQVFLTRILTQLSVGAGFGLVAFAILFANMRVARAMAPRVVQVGAPSAMPPQLAMMLEAFRSNMGPILDTAILWGAVALAFFNGLGMSANWVRVRMALAGVDFGYTDPQFGRDIGFYVFRLPALMSLSQWLFGILILSTLLTLLVHLLDGAIQPWQRLRGFAPHVKAHLSVLLAAIVLSRGFEYWLDIWKLNFSERGQVTGASYTDIRAQLPAYTILIAISAITALGLLLNIRYKGWRLPLISLGVWLGASVLLGGVFPAIVQQFIVAPNEVAREAPYITRNIQMTRKAFGLEQMKGKSFPAAENLSANDVVAAKDTLRNVRLWDPNIVGQSYSQLQSIRPYYEFPDVDVDRYSVNGQMRQVLVSAREMNSSLLPEQAHTWVNSHLVYTHGFGLVMSPVNEADSRGLPKFIIGDVPPKTSSDLKSTQPRIYFGESPKEYVVVDTGIKEFDYPMGERNAEYEYKGKAGVAIGSLGRRLAWAIDLGSSQVLFSEYIKSDSRVLLRRDLTSRLQALAPFLRYEGDPYPVLLNGRITWVIDAYTTSRFFPYSQRQSDGINYIRNSVKVTVDAFDGTTTFYAFDDKDPVLKAWRNVFPGLVRDGSDIPEGIRKHLRYPEGMFEVQADVYRTYHMTDPRVFYNKEDQWQLPGERQNKPMKPFYVFMQLPGGTSDHFFIMQPYTPRNRDNMIGWVAADSDPATYGERTVYMFPKERVVLGPEQISARINQDAQISPQLSLWNQRGSSVLFGNQLVLPIKDAIVYVQPLYLQAEQTAIPELTRVIVAYADKIAMERDLESALLKVFGTEVPQAPGSAETSPTPGTAADAATAARLYREAIDAQRKGDWAGYGQAIAELGKVLERMASSESSTTTK
jgi:uncharacterized membrane protein (UPF0182 family)